MSSIQIEGLRSEYEQAARLGVCVRTLRRWRDAHYGPDFIKLGRAYFYRPEAEAAFLASRSARSNPRRRGGAEQREKRIAAEIWPSLPLVFAFPVNARCSNSTVAFLLYRDPFCKGSALPDVMER